MKESCDGGRASMPVAMTIAGSDSGGGAGIQADLKTFCRLGVFGTTAITCITAQNPDSVAGVAALDPEMVALQIRTVCEGFPVAAAKTGMLYSADIIRTVADTIAECGLTALVVDPVMVATSGAKLLRDDAIDALRSLLLPRATVVTPNLPEAELLTGTPIDSVDALKAAAEAIAGEFGVACVAKGGHLRVPGSGDVTDILYADGVLHEFRMPRVAADETHGTGCTFSAAVTALLALGHSLADAVNGAQAFVADALAHAPRVGDHRPLAL